MELDTEINAGDGVEDEMATITPKLGMEFPSQDDAYQFYNRYALKLGFGTRWSTTNHSRSEPGLVISRKFVCRKEGKKKALKEGIVDEDVVHRREVRVDCKAMMKIILTKSGNWKVSIFVHEHDNHEMSTPSKVVKHWSHQKAHRLPVTKNLMTDLHDQGISNTNIAKVVNSLTKQNVTPQQVHEHLRVERRNNMGKNCVQVVKHFIEKKAKDPLFYSSFEVDDDMTLRSVFWADGRSQEAYKHFSDVIIFDVTYRTNSLCLPFAPFTGINHHRQSSLFGCALLADETENTFVWLFQQWLACMGGKAPGAIITDQDAAIGNAISKVFPKTTVHRYCDWHLDKNIGVHMVSLKAVHGPEFEVYFNRLRTSSTIFEAESTWKELMARYKLENNSWLPRLWVHRACWVHCYFIDTFLAGTRTSQRSESINSFFDKFVHASTPLHEFVLQYDKALASRRKAEEDEDFKSMESKPVLSSGSPLEAQAGRCYTRALFSIFQKEIKDVRLYWADKVRKEGTVTVWDVGRMGTDQSTWRTVSYNSDGHVVSCSCKHFEFVGLLCRHALCVYWKKLVKEIPARYILERWTLEARYRSVAGDMGDDVGVSEMDRDRHWIIRHKCNRAVELASRLPTFAEEFDEFLTRKFAEYDNLRLPNGVDVSSQTPNSQVDPIAPNFSPNIRDPTGPARHKGRPRVASRILFGLEESQDESTKKRRKCGYCGEKGHYRTGCSKAKEDNVAQDGTHTQ